MKQFLTLDLWLAYRGHFLVIKHSTKKINSLQKTIYTAAVSTYGKTVHTNKIWFEANIIRLESVINAKGWSQIRFKLRTNLQNIQVLKAARNRPNKQHGAVLMTTVSNC